MAAPYKGGRLKGGGGYSYRGSKLSIINQDFGNVGVSELEFQMKETNSLLLILEFVQKTKKAR